MKTNSLLKVLGQDSKAQDAAGMSRRDFLKVVGSGTAAAGLTACADSPKQNILPFAKGEHEQIPGVAVWYNSTCTECSAGCGVSVRTREGRAVKIEGNRDNPVNRGGLCALGQSALQDLYDPDRIRQPLERTTNDKGQVTWKPLSWDEAYAKVAELIKNSKKKKAFITGEVSGALEELTSEWCDKFKVDQVTFDATQPMALVKASELVYGMAVIPEFRFDAADALLNFGADFLETWVSPVGYARDWATARKSKNPIKVTHVEPRLSLTGANADMWLTNSPGSETGLALAILKLLLDQGRGGNLAPDFRAKLVELTKDIELEKIEKLSGVSKEKILLVANQLSQAKNPLVIAGGVAATSSSALELQLACAYINSVLGSVGKTVRLNAVRKPKTSVSKLSALIEEMKKDKYDLLFVYGSNPQFNLPASFGFLYARKVVAKMVSFSSHFDDTTELADLILPTNHSLESWGDIRNVAGVYSLIQPAMTTVFDTRSVGDSLLELGRKAADANFAGGKKDFEAYLKASWEKLYPALGANSAGGFQRFWLEALERGGYFAPNSDSVVGVKTKFSAENFKFEKPNFEIKDVKLDSPVVYPYLSVKSFDGRAANRPWMQELADPITQIVWDSWAEIHPETAKRWDLAQGDMVSVRNFYGEVNLPVYVTEHVHPGIVAVPVGQGHSNYGRYAKQVKGGNVLDLLGASLLTGVDTFSYVSTKADLIRGRGRSDACNVQGSDSQLGRGLARTIKKGEPHKHEAEEQEEVLQMYEQREHPFYRWGLAVDLESCTGCSACVVACYAENNIPVVGKKIMNEGREMSWLRIERYYDGSGEELVVNFLPMMCQQCGNAPCEPVCPVYATYHNEEGLNAMIYNRCVGTRYCSNNCSYKVRRFNWYEYNLPEPLNWQLNPDVAHRTGGVMEKCTFCVQRIVEAKDRAKDLGRPVQDGEIKPACVQSCPTQALTFGNLNDENSRVSKLNKGKRAYKVLDKDINTQPAVTYLSDIKYKI